MVNTQTVLVLEPSTNTHTLKCEEGVKSEQLDQLGGVKMNLGGTAVVLHGEHGVVATEGEHVIKLVQQEFNPVTKALQNSFD